MLLPPEADNISPSTRSMSRMGTCTFHLPPQLVVPVIDLRVEIVEIGWFITAPNRLNERGEVRTDGRDMTLCLKTANRSPCQLPTFRTHHRVGDRLTHFRVLHSLRNNL